METEISGRLLITGDLHGDTAALTMLARQLREGDALFVAGDFGFVFWDNKDEHVFLDDVDRFLQKINNLPRSVGKYTDMLFLRMEIMRITVR